MARANELRRVLAPGGKAILVLQTSYYKEIEIALPDLYADLAANVQALNSESLAVQQVNAALVAFRVRQPTVHPADRADSSQARRARRACTSSGGRRRRRRVHILRHHLLLAGNAWSARPGHPGARRTRGPDDDAAATYMHSSPAALDNAIRLLEQAARFG